MTIDYNKSDYAKLVNSIEEGIEYNNTNLILLQVENWYLIRNSSHLTDLNSYGYHRYCPMDLNKAPFLHCKELKCRGCGELPPDGMAGAYSLHNMEYIQQGAL